MLEIIDTEGLSPERLTHSRLAQSAEASVGLEVAERSVRARVQMIDGMLDISRIIFGKIALEMRVVNLTPVFKMTIARAGWNI